MQGNAEQLLIAPPTAAELVSRMVEGGLLAKRPGSVDRRPVERALTARAQNLLEQLTQTHLEELGVSHASART